MKQFVVLLGILSTYCSSFAAKSSAQEFSFYLTREPRSLEPTRMRGSSTSYLFANLFRGLYLYDDKKGLVPDGAQDCTWSKNNTVLTCTLAPRSWSDGQPVVAEDYIRAFRNFVSPRSKSVRVELLLNLKNARSIYTGKLAPTKLGVRALAPNRLQFELEKPDPEFKHTLTNPLLVPLRSITFGSPAKNAKQLIVNGPYRIHEWRSGRSILLTSNTYYPGSKRPNVRVFFISEDSTALSLYESGRLQFLWRLPTKLIPAYRNRPDYVRVGFARFDYLGFGPEFSSSKHRKAFALALNYDEMKKLYHSEGRPGCPALPLEFVDREVCYPFQPQKGRKAFTQLPESFRNTRFKFGLSHFGGSGNRTVAEWIQAEWAKHLAAKIDIQQLDQKYFLKMVRESPTSIFRKGVGLLRPTCAAALQTFTRGNRENYIKYDNPKFDALVKKLRFEFSETHKRVLCRQAIEVLMADYALIPLGRMHFNFLVNPKFKGWRVNSLNQLDLSQLRIE